MNATPDFGQYRLNAGPAADLVCINGDPLISLLPTAASPHA